MQNIKTVVDGDILTLTIDMTKDFGLSTTKKTRIVASSQGAVSVPGAEHISMTVTLYKAKK